MSGIVIVLNFSVWTVGAEILHARGLKIDELRDLARLLTEVLGRMGGPIFYLGAFAAIFSTMVGNATGYGYLLSDVVRTCRPAVSTSRSWLDSEKLICRAVAAWCLFPPLIWCRPGMPSFVTLTILMNAASVVVLPFLSAVVWYLTSSSRCIGARYRNRWWENTLMASLFALSCWGGIEAFRQVLQSPSAAQTKDDQKTETDPVAPAIQDDQGQSPQ